MSKNDRHEAWALVERFDLAEYFLYPAIGWGRKSDSLRRIAERLNIGLDTFAFVDDSAFEQAEVAEALPMVRVYDGTSLEQLPSLPELDVPMTEFSSQRRTQYLTQLEREQAVDTFAGDYLDFLRSCRLELEVFEPRESDQIERCLGSSSARTSSTSRSGHTPARSSRRCSGPPDPGGRARGPGPLRTVRHRRLRRRGRARRDPAVRDFVLSCRIAQKRIEHAFLGWLAEREAELGATHSEPISSRTSRNGPLQQVFEDLPFESTAADGERISYVLALPAELPDGIVSVRDLLAT